MVVDLFYRRPSTTAHFDRSSFESGSSIEQGKKSDPAGIPENLSFDRILNGCTSPPCTLDDFGKYLRFSNMAGHADALQFYVWVKSYERKFGGQLSAADQALSPPWGPTDGNELALDGLTSSRTSPVPTSPMNADYPGLLDVTFGQDMVLKPFTIQPFRSDVERVSAFYLAPDAPFALPIPAVQKSETLQALRKTTHPTAFLNAMTSVEMALRMNAHPMFIRHSLGNATRMRLFWLNFIGYSWVVIAVIGVVVLTLSSMSRWYRLISGVLLFSGLNVIANARRNICVLLIVLGMARNLSPWEVYAVDYKGNGTVDLEGKGDHEGSKKDRFDIKVLDLDAEMDSERKDEETRVRWFVKEYDNKPILSRVFERRVPVKDPEIRRLQMNIMIQNWLLAFCLMIIVEGIFVILPAGNFF